MFSFKPKNSNRLSLPVQTSQPATTLQPTSSSVRSSYPATQPPLNPPSTSAPGTPSYTLPSLLDQEQQSYFGSTAGGQVDSRAAGEEQDPTANWVSMEQYQNVLKNFRVAHAMIETQREQLKESERQVEAKTRIIGQLEGDGLLALRSGKARTSTDDYSIKTAASALASVINRYAASLVLTHPNLLPSIRAAVLADNLGPPAQHPDASPMRVQSLVRHAVSEVVGSGVVNVLLVTDCAEANEQFTRVHDNLFARDALVASVWRRQTFSASIESFSPALQFATLSEHMPSLLQVLLSTHDPSSHSSSSSRDRQIPAGLDEILVQAWEFARVVHASRPSSAGNKESFYRAFVPDMGSALDPSQIELVKRCHRTEAGEHEVVGACLFPGLVKVWKKDGVAGDGTGGGEVQNVVRRAQVICSCALMQKSQPQPQHQASSHDHSSYDRHSTDAQKGGEGTTAPLRMVRRDR